MVAFCKMNNRMYTTNGENNQVDIIDISNPSTPTFVSAIDMSSYGTGINSVAVYGGKVAVAVQNGDAESGKKQLRGSVEIFDAQGTHLKTVKAGYLPDMVTFNEDGTKIIVANEGEPNGSYTVDPVGSIGIIEMADYSYTDIGFANATLTSANDGTAVRLGDTPSNDKTKDLEPEYVTVSGNYAYVTLQENNAMAKVNLTTNSLEYVKSYGAKSWEVSSKNTLDIEEEGVIMMKSYPGLFGLYQPDSITSYTSNGATYLVTANEGDGREYLYEIEASDEADCDAKGGDDWDDGECLVESHNDEKKIKKLDLDASIADAYTDENDLKVMVDLGKNSSDEYEKLYTYGARSFSIWDDNGDLVWDSGDMISKLVAQAQPKLFNQDEGEMDGRSGNKGAEPEALTVGAIDGKTYAFIGLERQNAIVVYDITKPTEASFVDYIETGSAGDISPEGMDFIPASESPNAKNLLLVSYEVSGSTVVYEVK
ncbi:MAG: choice-of-anchor I family protein [Campylobacterota bacterium]|nr:choice-of-anchor I family protein [Campylobacterota bacterium]